jgi:hypothetical protein
MRAYHYRYPVRLSQEHRLWLETIRRTSRTPAKHYLVARVLLMSDQRNPGASLKRRMETLSGAWKMCWTSIVNPTILRCPRSVWMKWARISSKTSIHQSQPSQDKSNAVTTATRKRAEPTCSLPSSWGTVTKSRPPGLRIRAISLTRSPLRLIPLTMIRTKYKILHPIGRSPIFGYIHVFFFSRVFLPCLFNSTPRMAAFVPLWDFTQYCLFVDRRQIIITLKNSVYFHPISA